MSSINKGKVGERAAVVLLKSHGFTDARRTKQHDGRDSADVECPTSLPDVHIEVKNTRTIAVHAQELADACCQAEEDANGKPWVVLWKPHGSRKWCGTAPLCLECSPSCRLTATVSQEALATLLRDLQDRARALIPVRGDQ